MDKQQDSIEIIIGDMLRQRKATLAVAESCTGGLIAHRLTSIAGASDHFLFSGVTYSNDAKVKVLGVTPDLIAKHGVVSEEVVKAMARGVRQVIGSTYAIATSGIAGPTGATEDKPVGTVWVGFASDKEVIGNHYNFADNERVKNKELFAEAALRLLLDKIKDI
jgi:nicotinamide-nucleotide amidase